MAAVISGVAKYDIDHASRLAEAMPNSRERNEAVDDITRALLVQGVDAAIAYPASIQSPELRMGFVSSIAGHLASKEPDKAAGNRRAFHKDQVTVYSYHFHVIASLTAVGRLTPPLPPRRWSMSSSRWIRSRTSFLAAGPPAAAQKWVRHPKGRPS